MEPVSFALGVFGGADVCIRVCRSFRAKYQSYKDSDQILKELFWQIQNHLLIAEKKIAVIKRLDPILEEDLKLHFSGLFGILQTKLQSAEMKLDRIPPSPGRLARIKFAVLAKTAAQNALEELDKWQSRMQLAWFLIARISNPTVDQQLTSSPINASDDMFTMKKLRETLKLDEPQTTEKSLLIRVDALKDEEQRHIPFSFTTQAKLQTGRSVLVDNVAHHSSSAITTANLDAITMGLLDIARVLARSDPMIFGILTCHGLLKYIDSGVPKLELVFEIPDSLQNPSSLRYLLASSEGQKCPLHSLDERFELAKRLARSVMFVHSSKLVHKNIRPETIIVFQDETTPLGRPFLVGFEKTRSMAALSFLAGDDQWERNLYRHPNRQGMNPEEKYKMQHDIYSLGVCLLEIGLWTSFVHWNQEMEFPTPGPGLDISDELSMKNRRKKATLIKKVLLDMSVEQLPGVMGAKYADVVVSCLKCLDKGNDGFGSEEEFEDEDGIQVGVCYLEKILMKLDEISV